MPRGYAVTDRQKMDFIQLVRKGATIRKAAEQVGVAEQAFYARTSRHNVQYDEVFTAMFAEAVEERARAWADKVEEKVEEWIDDPSIGDSVRIAWMKRRNPAYRDDKRLEIVGPGGGPAEITVKHDAEKLVAMLEEVGLVRRADTETVDGGEPTGLLPARTD